MSHSLKRGDGVRARMVLVLDNSIDPVEHIQAGQEGLVVAILDGQRALVVFDGLSLPWAVGYNSMYPELIEVEPVRERQRP
jgi:hypothetical protein